MQCAPGRSSIGLAAASHSNQHRCAAAYSYLGPDAPHCRVRAFGSDHRVARYRADRHLACRDRFGRTCRRGLRNNDQRPNCARIGVAYCGVFQRRAHYRSHPARAPDNADPGKGGASAMHRYMSVGLRHPQACAHKRRAIALPPIRSAGCRACRGGDDSPSLIEFGLHRPDRANPAPRKRAPQVSRAAWTYHGVDLLENLWTWVSCVAASRRFVYYRCPHWTSAGPAKLPAKARTYRRSRELLMTRAASTTAGLVPSCKE